MCDLYRVGRRSFLADLGKGALAVAVFAPVIAACSDDEGSGVATTAPTVTTFPPTSGATSTTPTTAGAGTTAAPTEGLSIQRVNLGFVSAYVLVRGRTAAVVDTGVAGSGPAIQEGLGAAGLGWTDVDHVILTHHHRDHAGSIGEVLGAATNATAYAGEADIASITSPRPLQPVGDGDDVFGLEIVATPGHTAGHVAILDRASGILVVGDAMNNSGDQLSGPNPGFTDDMTAAVASAKKLAELPLTSVFFGHGEPITAEGKERLAELAASL